MFVVIVPSRGRPENIRRLYEAWENTVRFEETRLVVAVDTDDPLLDEYKNLPRPDRLWINPRLGMIGTLNLTAWQVCTDPRVKFVGFAGDDHLPRTLGWDTIICSELEPWDAAIVYGNDLIQGESLPTAVFMSAQIVRTLGWMVPPGLKHLFADNAWRLLGRELGVLRYLPEVVIEHMHPLAGKAESDDGYTRVNAGDVWEHDEKVFNEWMLHGLAADVEKVRRALDL